MKVYFPFKFVNFLICSFKLFLGIFTSMIAMSTWRVCGFIIMKSSLSLLILFILKFTLFDSKSHSYPFMMFARHICSYHFISICPSTLLYFRNTSYRKCTVRSSIFILKIPWTLLDFLVNLLDCSYWRVWLCPSICCLLHLISLVRFAFRVLFWVKSIRI